MSSRVRNAGEFLHLCSQARQKYKEIYKPNLEEIRTNFARDNISTPQNVDESLEFHIREYFINPMLQALNWSLDCTLTGDHNLIPESPVTSVSEKTTRFLDYFGIEQKTDLPLLIVETKRPDSLPPRKKHSRAKADFITGKDKIASTISEGLTGEELSGDWNEWLKTLKDYVQSVYSKCNKVPKRVVITNGGWLIIFIDPADGFLPSGSCNPSLILVYELANENWEESPDFSSNYNEIYKWLEYQCVKGDTNPLSAVEVAFHIKAAQVAKVLHGLRILYISEPTFRWGTAKPQIKVAPIIFLQSSNNRWIIVEEKETDEYLPHSYEKLQKHLTKVRENAEKLLTKIGNLLKIHLTPSSIEVHFLNSDEFNCLPSVKRVRRINDYEEYLVVTGQHTHYLKPNSSLSGCRYHDWGNSKQEGKAEPDLYAIGIRSVQPRSFFLSGEEHHCTHQDVALLKNTPITLQNREDCGMRSGKDYDAFCEIIHFEKQLCCRTCVYENVCVKSPIFKLPCSAIKIDK